jgi:hypothetical protein
VSKLCEKSVIEKLFTNPAHHQNELRKQLPNYQPSQPETNSNLVESLRNEIKSLKAQLLIKDNLVNDIKNKMSSFENDLKMSRIENEKLNNLNATLRKGLSEISKKYNPLHRGAKNRDIIKKSLFLNTIRSKCRSNNFDSGIAESYTDHPHSTIGSEGHLSNSKFGLKEKNQELTNTIEYFRKENNILYSQNQKLKPCVEAIKYW